MKKILILFAIIVTSLSCKKEEPALDLDQLTEPTTEGLNTFSCYIGDQIFIANTLDVIYSINYSFVITAKDTVHKRTLKFRVPGTAAHIPYVIRPSATDDKVLRQHDQVYLLEDKPESYIVFKRADPAVKVMAGNFHMTLRQKGFGGRKLNISHGRFDVSY